MLGTGTPTPSVRRMCSGYLVEIGGDFIVFDHGFGAHHRLLELGISATQISHAFFSHHHYDHIGDYPRLLLTRWDQGAGKVPELEVYGPPGLRLITQRLIADDGAFGLDLISRTQNQASIDVFRARGGEGERARPQPAIHELEADDVVRRNRLVSEGGGGQPLRPSPDVLWLPARGRWAFFRLFRRHGPEPRARRAREGLRRACSHVPLHDGDGAQQDVRRIHDGTYRARASWRSRPTCATSCSRT